MKICKVRKVGTSLVVTIPQSIAQLQNIQNGTKLELSIFLDVLQFKIAK